jgi:uncharacterized membrane protein SirB2
VPFTPLKLLHITFAVVSISGFVLRWLWLASEKGPFSKRWIRIAPHVVDTLFLATGVALMLLTAQYPWTTPWLAAKLIGLLAYILSGVAAMSARSTRARTLAFLCAIVMYAWIVSVARLKSPTGLLEWLC